MSGKAVNCPICNTPVSEAGDGLPVYVSDYHVVGGVKEIAMFVCDNDECGVLFSRRRELLGTTHPPETESEGQLK